MTDNTLYIQMMHEGDYFVIAQDGIEICRVQLIKKSSPKLAVKTNRNIGIWRGKVWERKQEEMKCHQ